MNTYDSREVRAYMSSRLPVYKELAMLELDRPEARSDPATLSRLREAGLNWNSQDDIEREWERINFISRHTFGRVLEIGCASGNITRYIASNQNVSSVFAVDVLPDYLDFLRQLRLDKVIVSLKDLAKEELDIGYPVDCVVMTELIEHIATCDEVRILLNIRKMLVRQARFIITTPVGFMSDYSHLRGFSIRACRRHLRLFYGDIVESATNEVQQFYIIQYRKWTTLTGLLFLKNGLFT